MKRILSLVLALCLLMGMGLASASAEAEKLPLRYYMPGSGTNLDQAVIDAVNDKMEADGLNIELIPMYIPWDAWADKINLMLSSGEEFELFQVMSDNIPFSTYQARGALAELDAVIDEYAPEMWDYFSEEIWSCGQIDGKTYIVPAQWRDASGDSEGQFAYRKDLMDKYGLKLESDMTIPEVIDVMVDFQAAWKADTGTTAYIWDHSRTRPPVSFHRTMDSWPFYVSLDGLFYVDQEGTAKAFFETEEFKQDCAWYADMYQKGLIHPDILSVPEDTKTNLANNGEILLGIDTFGEEGETALKAKLGDEVDIEAIWLNPEKPVLMSLPLLNSNAVPVTCKHPEAPIQFLNWLYSDPENHNLLIYGFEGEHYTVNEDGTIVSAYREDGTLKHRFDDWMIAKLDYRLYEEGTPQAVIDDFTTCRFDYVTSPVLGFNFNSEPVKIEYAQVLAEYSAVILPIKLGVVSYEDNFESALANMKAAGIDTVIAEYQRQLDEYLGK